MQFKVERVVDVQNGMALIKFAGYQEEFNDLVAVESGSYYDGLADALRAWESAAAISTVAGSVLQQPQAEKIDVGQGESEELCDFEELNAFYVNDDGDYKSNNNHVANQADNDDLAEKVQENIKKKPRRKKAAAESPEIARSSSKKKAKSEAEKSHRQAREGTLGRVSFQRVH